jgi:hypothetical protein
MITASVTVDDYIAAHRLHLRRRSLIWYAIGAAVLVVGVVMVFAGVKTWAPITIMAGVGGLLGQWWEDRIGMPSKVRRLYAQFKGIEEAGVLTWNAEYLEGRSANGQGKRKWRDYVRFTENEEVFLLYLTDDLWEAIPKRSFSAEQLVEFRSYASKAGEI